MHLARTVARGSKMEECVFAKRPSKAHAWVQ